MAKLVQLDDDLETPVPALSLLEKRSSDWIMREAVTEYGAREEARESFKKEALASWAEFQESGEHLTLEEVSGWFEARGKR